MNNNIEECACYLDKGDNPECVYHGSRNESKSLILLESTRNKMNNNTPELTAEAEDTLFELIVRMNNYDKTLHESSIYTAGFTDAFRLLWPYVGKAFEAGVKYSDQQWREMLTMEPDPGEYLTQVLTELKSKADANP